MRATIVLFPFYCCMKTIRHLYIKGVLDIHFKGKSFTVFPLVYRCLIPLTRYFRVLECTLHNAQLGSMGVWQSSSSRNSSRFMTQQAKNSSLCFQARWIYSWADLSPIRQPLSMTRHVAPLGISCHIGHWCGQLNKTAYRLLVSLGSLQSAFHRCDNLSLGWRL